MFPEILKVKRVRSVLRWPWEGFKLRNSGNKGVGGETRLGGDTVNANMNRSPRQPDFPLKTLLNGFSIEGSPRLCPGERPWDIVDNAARELCQRQYAPVIEGEAPTVRKKPP
jgi:hypothetical protein